MDASVFCYTDVHICDGDWAIEDARIRRDLTVGHEAVGVIESVGMGVDDLQVDARVGATFLCSAFD